MSDMFHVTDAATFGAYLVKLRTQRGLSRRAAAKQAKVSSGALRLWESGQSMPLVGNVDALMRFYGATVTIGHPAQPDEVLP